MKANNKLFASVAGVCITAAVVIGAVLGASGHDKTPAQQPASEPTAIASTVTATVTASPTATVVAKVSPSTKKAAKPKRQAVIQQQEPAVTDPIASDSSTPADLPPIDQASSQNIKPSHPASIPQPTPLPGPPKNDDQP